MSDSPKKSSDIKGLLALRRAIGKKRPKFVRQESWRYKRIRARWRKPKGIDSKMRLHMKGWPKSAAIGYRGPSSVRGLHPSGLKDVLVNNVKELERVDKHTEAARIGSKVGARKRKEMIGRARQLGIRVLNASGVRFIESKV